MQTAQASATQIERLFWLRWVVATTIGSIIGGAGSGAMIFSGEMRFAGVSSPIMAVVGMAVTVALAFAARGAALGVAQGLVLRHTIVQSGWWVVATIGGWAVAGSLTGALAGAFAVGLTHVGPDAGPLGLAASVVGGLAAVLFLPGLAQWLALRRVVEGAGWWVWAHALSHVAGAAISFPVMVSVAHAMGWNLPSAEAWGSGGALTGLIGGMITGYALVQLLRRRVQPTASA